jgi:hypothetical protein
MAIVRSSATVVHARSVSVGNVHRWVTVLVVKSIIAVVAKLSHVTVSNAAQVVMTAN